MIVGLGATIERALMWAPLLTKAASMEHAVNQANQSAQMNDSVLLSPACASLDMFENFEHRGQVFCELVNNL